MNLRSIKLLVICLCLSGCSIDTGAEEINKLPRPLKIVACGTNGAIIEDGKGELHSFRKGSKVGDILAACKLKRGEVIVEAPTKVPEINWKVTTIRKPKS